MAESPEHAPPFSLGGIDHIPVPGRQHGEGARLQRNRSRLPFRGGMPQYGMAVLRAGAALINLVDISTPAGAWALPGVAGGRNRDRFCIALGSP
jgi:hypothetical protein